MKGQEPKQLNDSVYEFYLPDGEIDVEIVAFHGLRMADYRDAYKTTWELENGSGCWLRDFLPKSFQQARILSVSYDSCAEVSDQAGRMSFSNLGIILVQDIIHLAEVGQRGCPVVLVGYCLGGLIIKQLCTEAEKQYDQAPDGSSKGRLDQFLTNVRIIFSMDTPQAGSALGDYLSDSEKCSGPVLEYLSKSSPSLVKLITEFEALAFERAWERACFCYCWFTKVWDSLQLGSGLVVVREESGRPGQEEFYMSQGDHSVRAFGSGIPWGPWESLRQRIRNKMQESKRPHGESKRSLTTTVKGDRKGTEKRVSDCLFEMYRPVVEQDAKLELIFFSGSFQKESYKTTWTAEDNKNCWLQTWLPDAFPEARIFAVSYPAGLDLDGSVDLFLVCENLIEEIIRSRKRRGWLPLILVGHCLGGIVIKLLCNQVEQAISMSDGERDHGSYLELLKSIRGIAFYSTSHSGYGSRYKQAGIQSYTVSNSLSGGGNRINFPEDGELSDKYVGRINADYLYNVRNLGWKELALGETQPTKQGLRKGFIVDEVSASHGIQRNSFFPVAADHFSICKPRNPSSNCFQYLVHFIHKTMNEAQYRNMNVRRKKRRGIAVIISMEGKSPGSEADLHPLEDMEGEGPGNEADRHQLEDMEGAGPGSESDLLEDMDRGRPGSEDDRIRSEEGLGNEADRRQLEGMDRGRPGSENDRLRLEEMADYLNFDPIVVLDRQASEFPGIIKNILEKEAKEEDECILCCVSGHGAVSDGIHYIFDNDNERINLLSQVLKPISDYPLFAGKPKVFVVNSCRGIIGGVQETGLSEEQNDLHDSDDCLLMYSTRLDTESWRRENGNVRGTLFLSELTYHISLLYQTTDVQDIFKKVKESVPDLAARIGVAQSPVMYSTLRKRLSWRPR